MEIPDVQYAKSGDVAIAYQVVGDGPTDLVFSPFVGNIRYSWEQPLFVRLYEQLSAFSRLILFDKRGTGLSDRPRVLSLEMQMDDVRAVLDAVDSERAVLLGAVQGSQLCALYAATYPERTKALVLYNPHASPQDVPEASPESVEEVRTHWGRRDYANEMVRLVFPSRGDDDAYLRWWADYHRFAVSPAAAAEFWRMLLATDIADILPTIRVPTLVLYRARRRDAALRVASLVAGARTVQVPGDDLPVYAGDDVAPAVERFLQGVEEPRVPESVLTTLLFTDIVGSTARANQLGDSGWRDVLARHHAIVRRELARFRGEERDTAGDGFFATFDGPARAVRCAQALVDGIRECGLEIRAGVHTGECELHEDKVAGIAVSIGARVAASARPGEVLVSQTVKDLVAGSRLDFVERGAHELKGVPGTWRLYAAR